MWAAAAAAAGWVCMLSSKLKGQTHVNPGGFAFKPGSSEKKQQNKIEEKLVKKLNDI